MNDDSRQATLNDLRDWRVFFVSGQMVAVTLPLPEIPLVQLSAKDNAILCTRGHVGPALVVYLQRASDTMPIMPATRYSVIENLRLVDGNPVPVELAAIYASAIAEAWNARAKRIYRAFAEQAFGHDVRRWWADDE